MNLIKNIIDEYNDMDFSDIHIREDKKLAFRYKGEILFTDYCINKSDIELFLKSIGCQELLSRLSFEKEIDFIFEYRNYRYRANIFLHTKLVGISMRKISKIIKTVNELGLPKILLDMTKYSSGIVFITGPTGSGKTTTLAALIEYINIHCKKHIVTIEDPIEYIFDSKESIITQREIKLDTDNFSNAIRSALRQDPDIIVIGEIRDEETMKMAIRAAETGHLCFCTLHTLGGAETIERIIGMFSFDEKSKIKHELTIVLRAIVSQRLILVDDEILPVIELLLADKSVCTMIKEDKVNQIANYIQTNISRGMISMDRDLIRLYNQNKISYEQLESYCIDIEHIKNISSKTVYFREEDSLF
ncbi:MAG: PilT/PilU family type 4a pilus ATPase [Peptostreptococcus sp.]|uniref:type IV pilus twitching motility protein PilT n=1 Tax=Peptostreptococcus sp. TaxID=1262 RepID=UPI002FC7B5BA